MHGLPGATVPLLVVDEEKTLAHAGTLEVDPPQNAARLSGLFSAVMQA
jgi:hypothetical protein